MSADNIMDMYNSERKMYTVLQSNTAVFKENMFGLKNRDNTKIGVYYTSIIKKE